MHHDRRVEWLYQGHRANALCARCQSSFTSGSVNNLPLNFGMVPATQDCRAIHLLPCLPRHKHSLKQVNLVDVAFAKLIFFDSTKAEFLPIISFEALNDPCVQRLDKGCHIWLEVQELNILWLVVDVMPQEVVEGKANVSLLNTHSDVQILDVSDCM